MRLVIQRVSRASVKVEGIEISHIGKGLLILIGIEEGDSEKDAEWLAAKTANMRIFPDKQGVMNLSVKEIEGELLVVSQFTLLASTKKGNRPSYVRSAGHEIAIPFYEKYCELLQNQTNIKVKKGVFGADMEISLINDGPVTIVIDSRLKE